MVEHGAEANAAYTLDHADEAAEDRRLLQGDLLALHDVGHNDLSLDAQMPSDRGTCFFEYCRATSEQLRSLPAGPAKASRTINLAPLGNCEMLS